MSNKTKIAFAFVGGLVVGGAATYFATKKMLSDIFEADLQEQIQDVKDHYKLLRKEGEFSTPETVSPKLYEEIISSYESKNIVELAQWEQDLLQAANEEVEEVVEIIERDTSKPYIISVKEYMEDRQDFDKNTITYFEEDDVLCDEREMVITDIESTVGSDSLTKFGTDSSDKNIVYVRNENISTDFEILRDPKSYSEIVLGIREKKGALKMREDD